MPTDQPTQNTTDSHYDVKRDGVDVAELALKLWTNRALLAMFVVLSIVGAAVYLNRTEYVYSASLIVTPVDRSSSRVSSGLSSLGSLVGVELGGGEGSAFTLYAEAIKSLPVAERLSMDPRVMQVIFAGNWDKRSQTWRERRSMLSPLTNAVKNALGLPVRKWRPPGPQDLQEVLGRVVMVDEDVKKGLIRLSVNHSDPDFAKHLLNAVNYSADDFLRQKSLARSSIYIRYLERRLEEVQVSEYRTSLSDALGVHEKTAMMASSSASFAAEPFGAVTVSSYPTSPIPRMVLLLSVVAATFLWAIYVLVIQNLLSVMRRHWRQTRGSG